MRNIVEDPHKLLSPTQRNDLLKGLRKYFPKIKYRISVTKLGRKAHIVCRDISWGSESLVYDWKIERVF